MFSAVKKKWIGKKWRITWAVAVFETNKLNEEIHRSNSEKMSFRSIFSALPP